MNPLPALLLKPFFARCLTLVPRSLLPNRTETLATQAKGLLAGVSLPPSSRASGVSPAPKTPFPFPFKRLPRRLLHCKPVMSQAQHFAQTARRGWLVRASRFARNAAFSLLGSKRASHAGKSLGCSNRSSHSITNQGEKKKSLKCIKLKLVLQYFLLKKFINKSIFKTILALPGHR